MLIVCDDFHLPLAKLRLRAQGSSGGQRGLEDVSQQLGTQQIGRLRVGVGPVPAGRQGADFVLGKFTADEQTHIGAGIGLAADAVECWVASGMATAMNRFNGRDPGEPTESEEN